MKLFKTVFAAAACAVMLSSCTDLTEADPVVLQEEGIAKKSVELYNTWGTGYSGLDAVKGEGVTVSKGPDASTGYVTYADSSVVDFKALNDQNRSYLQKKLVSLNGTKYAQIDSAEFARVTKNVKTFKEKVKAIADAATANELVYSSTAPYFVAKLGKDRGYCLANVTTIDTAFAGASTKHTGIAKVDYYYVSAAKAAE